MLDFTGKDPSPGADAIAAADRRHDFDQLVLGSGPAGQRVAIQAAKLGKRVAVVQHKSMGGGVCINTGTIPTKTLREAVPHFSGYRERSVYGASYSVKQNVTMSDLLFRADNVIRHEIGVTSHQLQRNNVHVLSARASFVDDHTLRSIIRMDAEVPN